MRAAALVLTVGLAACVATTPTPRSPEQRDAQRPPPVPVFRAEDVAILCSADRVTARRIDIEDIPDALGMSLDRIGPLLGPEVAVPAPLAAGLAGLLAPLAKDDCAKACLFTPGVLLTFRRGASRVDVLVCLVCDEVAGYHDGVFYAHEDIDHLHGALLDAFLELFPGDAGLLDLRARRGR